MEHKVLIAYASKTGATMGIAEKIGETLSTKGYLAEVKPVGQVKELSEYQTVILGSGIRGGSFLPDAAIFVDRNLGALRGKDIHVFLSCMTMQEETTESRQRAEGYLNSIRDQLKPVSEGLFAGALDYNKLDFMEKLIMRAMGAPSGDFRDWEEITGWAEQVAESISK